MLEQITIPVLILTMIVLWIFNWRVLQQWREEQEDWESYKQWLAKKAGENVEQRCQHCKAGKSCPGYNTGVIYPCSYYEEEEHGTED